MQKFQFLLFTYWLDSVDCLKEVTPDVIRTVLMYGNLQNMSTLGGLPSGLGTLHSGPACANIFLMSVYRKSLCEILLPPHEE